MIACSLSACGAENASQSSTVRTAEGGQTPTTIATAAPTAGATSPAATAPPADSTAATPAPEPAPAPVTGGGSTPPGSDGGAQAGASPAPSAPSGDERGNRVPVAFTVSSAGASPTTIAVPPFLGLELRLSSSDGAGHTVTLRVAPPVTVTVPASGTVVQAVGGLQAGTYTVDVDGAAAATLRVADDAVGP